MHDSLRDHLAPVRHGLALGFVAVLYGWGLGLYFGVGEDQLRKGFLADAEAKRALYVQKAGSEEGATAAIKRIDETAWRYVLRAHLHAGGIGALAIGMSLVLAFLSSSPPAKTVASTLLGIGSVGYPLFWMLAGLRAPGLGSTAAAKESLRWLAIPSAGALAVGGVVAFSLLVADLFLRRPRTVAATLLVLVLGTPAAAQDRGEGPATVLMTYKAAPAHRVAFREAMEKTGAAEFARWQKEGVFADHTILFSSYVNQSWDMLVVLRFDRYADLAKWREVEKRFPSGLSAAALAAGSPVTTVVGDVVLEDAAKVRGDRARSAWLVVPYEYEDKAVYRNYVEAYVIPQVKGWMREGILSSYTIFLNHNDAGPPVDSVFLFEYRDVAALAKRRLVIDRIRGELKGDTAWQTVHALKGHVREEGEIVPAERLLPR